MKVVSTDHNETNNLTSLIICFSNQRIYIYVIYIYIYILIRYIFLFLLSMLRPNSSRDV